MKVKDTGRTTCREHDLRVKPSNQVRRSCWLELSLERLRKQRQHISCSVSHEPKTDRLTAGNIYERLDPDGERLFRIRRTADVDHINLGGGCTVTSLELELNLLADSHLFEFISQIGQMMHRFAVRLDNDVAQLLS